MESVAGEQGLALHNFFHTNLLSFLEIQTLIKSHSLMPGASNWAILLFSTCFFHFWLLKVAAHNFMKSRSHDDIAARGPYQCNAPSSQLGAGEVRVSLQLSKLWS